MLTREKIISQVKKMIITYKSSTEIKSKIRLNYLSALKVNTTLLFAHRLKFINKFNDYGLYWDEYFKQYKNFLNLKKLYLTSEKNSVYNKLLAHKHYILTFKSFTSNFFIMVMDNLGNPLISCSTGQVSKSRSKKKKNSIMLIYSMMRKIKAVLIKHRVKYLSIHIRTDISPKVIAAINFLNRSRIKFHVTYIALVKPIPHHFGKKQKKPRRV